MTSTERGRVAVLLAGLGKAIAAAGKATHEILICVTGTWVKNSHQFSITSEDLDAMVRNFQKRKNDQVVIDYEHASEQPEVAKGGPIPAAGWIHALRLGNGSLHALVEWTPEAAQLISAGQYRFFSPAIDWSFPDKETGNSQGATLTSGALTNHPFLEELPPITLTESGLVLADVSTGYLDAPVNQVSVGYKQGVKMAKKLSIKKLSGGEYPRPVSEGARGARSQSDSTAPDARGHHGIFDGDDFLGYVHADDLKEHLKSCMDDGYGDLDDLPGWAVVKDVKPKGHVGTPGHQSDLAGKASIQADIMMREQGISYGQALRKISAEPTKYLTADPSCLPPVERSGEDLSENSPDKEVVVRANKLMKEEGLTFRKAVNKVLSSDRKLAERYNSAHGSQLLN